MKKSIVISCAGKGSRLGLFTPKCLVDVAGKKIIERQLECLNDCDDIIVVVGYKAEEVINFVEKIRPSVKFVYNYEYEKTGPGTSFILGSKAAKHDFVIALDGDLLVYPEDLKKVLEMNEEFVCGEQITTEDPMYLQVENGRGIGFSRESGNLEWSGLAGIFKQNIIENAWNVCDVMEAILPVKAIEINAKEIDTSNDFIEAERWINNNYDKNKLVIDEFFKSRFLVENPYEAVRYHLNNRDEYDVNFLKEYINQDSEVLDLGCGTGVLEKHLSSLVKSITAIDKYQEFLDRACPFDNVQYTLGDLITYRDSKVYDLILLFGITIYLFDEELNTLINNVLSMLGDASTLIIKNQWGIEEDVVIDNYSEHLKHEYYAKYRKLATTVEFLKQKSLEVNVIDIYPPEMNKWDNTHEYALVCKKVK